MECTNKCQCRRCQRWRTAEQVYFPMLGYFGLMAAGYLILTAIK